MRFLFQKCLQMGARSPDPRKTMKGRWRGSLFHSPDNRTQDVPLAPAGRLRGQSGRPDWVAHFMAGPCGSPAQTCNPLGIGLATFLLVCLLVPRSRAFPLSQAKVLRGRGWNVTWLMNHLLLAGGHSRPGFSLLSPSPTFPFTGVGVGWGGDMDMSP